MGHASVTATVGLVQGRYSYIPVCDGCEYRPVAYRVVARPTSLHGLRQPNEPPPPFTQCDYATQIGRSAVTGSLDDEFTHFATVRLASIRRVAYLLCQDWQRADDLVQTAITRLYVRWARARSMEHTEAYLRTILVREYLSEQRSGWARRVSLDAQLPETSYPEPDRDIALDVRAALAALPPRQRATLVLRFYCDLNVEQTAELLGCSVGTVKSQSAKALDALRGRLGHGRRDSVREASRYSTIEVTDHG